MSSPVRTPRKRLVFGTALVAGVAAAVVAGLGDRRAVEPSSVTGSSEHVHSILAALPITLEQPFPHDWSAERTPVREGWLLALEVDPEQVVPRQVAEPVLYVGDQTVERINRGDVSGRVIAIVPERVDLESAPIWFGAPELPERVDRDDRLAALSRATAEGAKPFAKSALEAARQRGLSGSDTEVVTFADRRELLDFAAQWIYEFSPEESDFATTLLRLPSGK